MTLPDFLQKDELGSIRLIGHRIDLAHLLHHYNEGYSPEMLWSEYPSLPLALIYKAIGYYLENQRQVDEYLAQFTAAAEARLRQPAWGPSLLELRQRLEAARTSQGA